VKHALIWVALLAIFVACSRTGHRDISALAGETPLVQGAQEKGGDPAIGTAKTFDNLTVFAVTSKSQDDIGPITTLDIALAKRTAQVKEVGADRSSRGDGAQVNSLVIENHGDVPIYVLAGTIVKGGKQDRQIGDDFIVGAHQTVPVDAFCVEHGRWTTNREGIATGGQFGVVGMLAESKVRTAAQYERNQGQGWAKVAAVNAANKKEAASGTLLASLDASDIAAKRAALASKVEGYFETIRPGDGVVGFAYALDGKVRSVRWFASHRVFQMFRSTLVNTAAMEAITAQSQAAATGQPAAAAPVASGDVSKFVSEVESGRLKEQRSTPALNDNEFRESKSGYGATTVLKGAGGGATRPRPVSKSVTSF